MRSYDPIQQKYILSLHYTPRVTTPFIAQLGYHLFIYTSLLTELFYCIWPMLNSGTL